MKRRTIAIIACMILFWTSPHSHAAEISGAWKINTQGGPVPLCNLVEVGNDLIGSCVGPQATGAMTGSVVGSTVRWRWQWVTYDGKAAGAFDFMGALQPDNSITGIVERRETGFSLNFTAVLQPVQSAQMRQINDEVGGTQQNSQLASRPLPPKGPQNLVSNTQQFLRNLSAQARPLPARRAAAHEPLIDPTIMRQANYLFPWASEGVKRRKFIIDEMNAAADRLQGHSYSIRLR